jgi:hypothetical protein
MLHIYVYDADGKSIGARGAAINITNCYSNMPDFSHLEFVAGTEELLLVEKNGRARIYSPVTENFRCVVLYSTWRMDY